MTTIKYKLLSDGGFVAGDTATGLTSYAYPTSDYAKQARKQEPDGVAAHMIWIESEHASFHQNANGRAYDERNWALLG